MAKLRATITIIDGISHSPLVLQITKRDPSGQPREFRAVYDDDTVSMLNEPEFVVVWVKPDSFTSDDIN